MQKNKCELTNINYCDKMLIQNYYEVYIMNVLITGKDSYIGNSLKKHLENSGYNVEVADTYDNIWKETDFSKYDSVVHVAAIVHDNAKQASIELFEKVNTVLPTEIAKVAKNSGVKQFVFLSTMGVYGVDKSLKHEQSVITEHTQTSPKSPYGKSKLDAEILLKKCQTKTLKYQLYVRQMYMDLDAREIIFLYLKKFLDYCLFVPKHTQTFVKV